MSSSLIQFTHRCLLKKVSARARGATRHLYINTTFLAEFIKIYTLMLNSNFLRPILRLETTDSAGRTLSKTSLGKEWFLQVHALIFLCVGSTQYFGGSPSLFELLLPKQFNHYCKSIITHRLHVDWSIFWYYYFYDRNENHVVSSWSNFSSYLHFFKNGPTLCLLCVLFFCCAKFHKNLAEKLWDILYMGYILCVN